MGTDEHTKATQREQGRRLKAARVNARLPTAAAAAKFLHISSDTYSAHENGNRGISTKKAKRYADAYGVSVDWLLYGTGAPEWATPDIGTDADTAPDAGHFLTAWRLFKGLSVEDLADRMRVPIDLLLSWEAGTAEIGNKRLKQLADIFETTAGSILDVDPASVAPNVLSLWRDTAERQTETRKLVAAAALPSVDDIYTALGGGTAEPQPAAAKRRA